MNSGILLVDKPQGPSSAATLTALKKRISEVKKIGHSGTLDPFATGLLVCFINSATRLARFAEEGDKVYSGVIQLGITTDTDDITGTVIERSDVTVARAEIERALLTFQGEIEQVPPKISAIKVNGKRAYRLARAGLDFDLKSRRVTLHSIEVTEIQESRVCFRVRCSKGVYIRSLARDVGELLGCGGCLSELRRDVSEPFSVTQAKTLDQVSANDILDWRSLFPSARCHAVSQPIAAEVLNGSQRRIRELQLQFGAEQKGAKTILTGEEDDRSLALFVRGDQSWELAANIGSEEKRF